MDIPVLAGHFLAAFSKEYNKTIEGFSVEAARVMKFYKWPGNVRELKNVVRGIVVLQNARVIMPEHLPAEISGLATHRDRERKEGFILPEGGYLLMNLKRICLFRRWKGQVIIKPGRQNFCMSVMIPSGIN